MWPVFLTGACDLNSVTPVLNLSADIAEFAHTYGLNKVASALRGLEKAVIGGKLTGACAHDYFVAELRTMADSIAKEFLGTAALAKLPVHVQSELKLGLHDLAAKTKLHFVPQPTGRRRPLVFAKAGSFPLTEKLLLGKQTFL